ncbi:hypothetical protein EDD15DRAFT_2200068 [Pisolithus albus]|nr:hypothetical protein EDD15DRAFT_2200068 [Pisolithus albus]
MPKGLKGKSRLSSYKHTLKKEGDSLEKGHHGCPKTLDSHIAWIIFLPYGVDMPGLNEDLDLSDPTLANFFPVIHQSIALMSAQLSRLEAADSMLHGEFSQLFEVLDTHPKVANPNYNTSGMVGRQYKYLPAYLLCLCSHKEIIVAGGTEFPDGEVLFQKVKAGKQPSRDKSEIILDLESHKSVTASNGIAFMRPLTLTVSKLAWHTGPSTLASMNAGPETIALTDGAMDTTPVNGKVSPTTPPLTPIQAMSQPAPSSSFTIDTTLMNPWKVTFELTLF